MRIATNDLNPGIWIELNPEKPELGRLCLRPASAEFLDELHKKHTKKKTVYRRHQPAVEEVTDEAAYKRDLWDYSIVDWEGIQDQDGEDIPCTTEWKARLIMESPLFLRYYSRCLARVEELMEERAEAEEGNFLSTSAD
jgi:hypothetical protein